MALSLFFKQKQVKTVIYLKYFRYFSKISTKKPILHLKKQIFVGFYPKIDRCNFFIANLSKNAQFVGFILLFS